MDIPTCDRTNGTKYLSGCLFEAFGQMNKQCSDELWVYRVQSKEWQQVHKPHDGRDQRTTSWPYGQCGAQIDASTAAADGGYRDPDVIQARIMQPGWADWQVLDKIGPPTTRANLGF